jgi:hypothetical protein
MILTSVSERLSVVLKGQSQPALPRSSSFAGTTNAVAVVISVGVGVVEWVTIFAVGLGSKMCRSSLWTKTSLNVDRGCYCLKVAWSYACAITAKMIQFKAFGNRTVGPLVRDAMGDSPKSIDPEVSIASRYFGASPDPARFGPLHFRPKSLFWGLGISRQTWRIVGKITPSEPTCVVFGTPSKTPAGNVVATFDVARRGTAFDTLCHVGPPCRIGHSRGRLRVARLSYCDGYL